MKFPVMLFTLLLMGSTYSIAYAHPVPLSVTVQDQEGVILFSEELGGYGENQQLVKQLDDDGWLYRNFIWVLAGAIASIMTITTIVTYREDIYEKVVQLNQK